MTQSTADFLNQLKTAIAGLQWMSESEYPFEVVCWTDYPIATLTEAALLELTHHSPDIAVETQDFDWFFEPAIGDQDWHSESEQTTVQQYQQLVTLLKQNLSDLRVYRIGTINLDIYALGQTETGDVAGVATKAVET
jgi:hypothetical protein